VISGCLTFAGFAWATLAFAFGSGQGDIGAIATVMVAAVLAFTAAWGLLTFRRWAPIVASMALLASVALGLVLFMALRAAFATFPF
jgi:hypothetical protein